MNFQKLLDNYNDYYNLNNFLESFRKRNSISLNQWLNIYNNDKRMVANLINILVECDSIVEFSDAYYIDKDELIPTISENFAFDGKNATLISKNVENKDMNRIKLINTNPNNPFGKFSELITPSNIKNYKDIECFVTECDYKGLIKHYTSWAHLGIPCVYAISGFLDKRFKEKSDNAEKMFNNAIKNNNLDVKVAFNYDKELNTAAKIYVLKK